MYCEEIFCRCYLKGLNTELRGWWKEKCFLGLLHNSGFWKRVQLNKCVI
jgi:hypothetical protein